MNGVEKKDIVITEYIAEVEISRFLWENKSELERRYSPFFLRRLYGQEFSREDRERDPEKLAAAICGVLKSDGTPWYQSVREGGLYQALWNLSLDNCCGFRVITEQVPMKQEWIEISELMDENPYQMDSGNQVILAVTGHGAYLTKKLLEMGIQAAIIGNTMPDHDRILFQGNRVRYLNRP